MSADDDFAQWAEEVVTPDVPIGEVSDVSTVRVGDKVMVIVGVPVPAGLDGDFMAEALEESISRASSVVGVAARVILECHRHFTSGGAR